MKSNLLNWSLLGLGFGSYCLFDNYNSNIKISRELGSNLLNTNLIELKNGLKDNVYLYYLLENFDNLNVFIDKDLYNGNFNPKENENDLERIILCNFELKNDLNINTILSGYVDSVVGFYSYLYYKSSGCVTSYINSKINNNMKKNKKYYSLTLLDKKLGRNLYTKTIIFDENSNLINYHKIKFVNVNWSNSFVNNKR